jgi:hypothetical protein
MKQLLFVLGLVLIFAGCTAKEESTSRSWIRGNVSGTVVDKSTRKPITKIVTGVFCFTLFTDNNSIANAAPQFCNEVTTDGNGEFKTFVHGEYIGNISNYKTTFATTGPVLEGKIQRYSPDFDENTHVLVGDLDVLFEADEAAL